jgi:deoxycytidine triphosphate deaminase
MYLSNRDIKWAIERGKLIVRPRPEEIGCGYDETSIDLHLDTVEEAKIWDATALTGDMATHGVRRPEVHLGEFIYGRFAGQYLVPPPQENRNELQPVCRRGDQVIVRPGGFLLWPTREWIGTPSTNPELICFVNAKSTRARTGLLVHLTAPTIHAGWEGKILLEIANLGPFDFILRENDAIAQLTVATISSATDLNLKIGESATHGQESARGRPERRGRNRRRRNN